MKPPIALPGHWLSVGAGALILESKTLEHKTFFVQWLIFAQISRRCKIRENTNVSCIFFCPTKGRSIFILGRSMFLTGYKYIYKCNQQYLFQATGSRQSWSSHLGDLGIVLEIKPQPFLLSIPATLTINSESNRRCDSWVSLRSKSLDPHFSFDFLIWLDHFKIQEGHYFDKQVWFFLIFLLNWTILRK